MLKVATIASIGVFAVSLGLAPQSRADDQSAQAKSCSDRAAQQGLQDKGRDTFIATCERGAVAPKHPLAHGQTQRAKALVDPSGVDPTVRSRQCNAEAGRRGLKDEALQAFRKGCLASAAPVGAIETAKHAEGPAKDKPKLDALTDAPKPH